MVRRVLLCGLTTLALGCCSGSVALASASDSATTLSYLKANYALVQTAHSKLSSSIASYRSVLSQVRRSCPQAAAASPQNPESTEVSNEVVGAMVTAADRPDLSAIGTYLRATAGLRWSSASVTRAVSSYNAKLAKLHKLSVPDLCGDIAAWKATGWTKLPSSTLSFDRVFYPNWVALGLLPPGIKGFETPAAKGLASSASRLEYQLTNAEAVAVETWAQIMNELEVNP
jgi:hypothetical protein